MKVRMTLASACVFGALVLIYLRVERNSGSSRSLDADSLPGHREEFSRPVPIRVRKADYEKNSAVPKVGHEDESITLDDLVKIGNRASKIRTLSEDGKLSLAIIREANLSSEEMVAAQRVLDNYRLSMENLVKEVLSVDPLETDTDHGVYAFSVNNFLEQGLNATQVMINRMDQSLGLPKSRVVLSGFPAAYSYFCCGSQDARIKVFIASNPLYLPGSGEAENIWMTETVASDPATGREISKYRCSLNTFFNVYGRIFEVDE